MPSKAKKTTANDGSEEGAALSFPSSSTSKVGKDILASATEAAIPYLGSFASSVTNDIRNERNWRWNYHRHVIRHMRVCASSPPDGALAVARVGLQQIYQTFQYNNMPLRDALDLHRRKIRSDEAATAGGTGSDSRMPEPYFRTGRIDGTTVRNNNNSAALTLPVGPKGRTVLRGPEVNNQMTAWLEKGVIEPDTAAAIRNLQPEQDFILSDSEWVFVVMGAGAAMGPLETLLSLGAHVIAIDLPIPAVWQRLFRLAKTSPGGSITFPMTPLSSEIGERLGDDNQASDDSSRMAQRAGCNLLTQITELIDWLVQQHPTRRLVLGSYAYLDSAAFVKVSLAMDAVVSETLHARPDSALAYLCSPTDCFAVPPAASEAAMENCRNFNTTKTQKWLQRMLPKGRILDQNVVEQTRGTDLPLVDGLVLQQGPNYFLAKRLQHWRCMVAKASDTVVSSNVAPASFTRSVTKNTLINAAFGGLGDHFPPLEVFEPETSNVLMTYLLLHDLKQQNQHNAAKSTDHPLSLFATTPVHNGIWRCPFKIRSIVEIVVAYYFMDMYRPHLVGTGTVATVAGAAYIWRSRL